MKLNILVIISITMLATSVVATDDNLLSFFNNMYSKNRKQKLRVRSQPKFKEVAVNLTGVENNTNATNAFNTTKIMEDWAKISSPEFKDAKRFPEVALQNNTESIQVDREYFRKNLVMSNDTSNPKFEFYFRMNAEHIFYASTKMDINVLGDIELNQVESLTKNQNLAECLEMTMKKANGEYKLCLKDERTRDVWYCAIATRIKLTDSFCEENRISQFTPTLRIESTTFQPIILVPQASPICNENFNYRSKGNDWECGCKEGMEQSPIDIIKEMAIPSPAAPVFTFEEVEAISPVTTLDGSLVAREHIKIKYYKNALRIFHTKFGKIVTLDGSVYHAEEIVFHSPAEHLLDGVRHEMEMQVIAYGQSKGDISKQVVLSFLFEKKPGVYNKFIDDVDFFNLPNKDFPEKNIEKSLFIPKVLYTSDSNEMVVMKPFSFFTYQGSITFPPCTERTIHYVAADPIPIGHAMITMLRESLRDAEDQSEDQISNIRDVQPLNGRSVFFYDASNCKTKASVTPEPKPTGHYEKVKKRSTEFFFVNSKEPSGLPDSYVVSENEAKGVQEKLE